MMFTLKFIQETENGMTTAYQAASAFQHYQRSPTNFDVIVNDINFRVSEDSKDFDHCFVENEAGKTIAHFSRYSGKKNGIGVDITLKG